MRNVTVLHVIALANGFVSTPFVPLFICKEAIACIHDQQQMEHDAKLNFTTSALLQSPCSMWAQRTSLVACRSQTR
jgi:hypothetical protein